MTPSDSICCAVRPLIAAWVATGMNVGSRVTPSMRLKRFSDKRGGPFIRPTRKGHSGYTCSGCMTCCEHFKLHSPNSNEQEGGARVVKMRQRPKKEGVEDVGNWDHDQPSASLPSFLFVLRPSPTVFPSSGHTSLHRG